MPGRAGSPSSRMGRRPRERLLFRRGAVARPRGKAFPVQRVPGSAELYVLCTLIMCVFSRLWASSVAPRTGFIPIALYVAFMFVFVALDTADAQPRSRQFLVQSAFVVGPAAVMGLWMVHG